MGGGLLTKLFSISCLKGLRRKVAFILIFLFFTQYSFMLLRKYFDAGKDIYSLSQKLKVQYGIKGNLASNKNWGDMTQISFYSKNKYFGEVGEKINNEELRSELANFRIKYFFVWADSKFDNQSLIGWHEITKGQIPGLKIYALEKGT